MTVIGRAGDDLAVSSIKLPCDAAATIALPAATALLAQGSSRSWWLSADCAFRRTLTLTTGLTTGRLPPAHAALSIHSLNLGGQWSSCKPVTSNSPGRMVRIRMVSSLSAVTVEIAGDGGMLDKGCYARPTLG